MRLLNTLRFTERNKDIDLLNIIMNKFLLILFSMASSFSYGQDWDLFPYEQKSYYGDDFFKEAFYTLTDSVKSSGDTTIYYAFAHSLLSDTVLCRSTLDSIAFETSTQGLVRRWKRISNTLYFSEYPEIENPIYISLDSMPGSSWPIYSTLTDTDIDHFQIAYDSIGYGMVGDVFDSLRYYSIQIDTIWAGDHNLDDQNFILSKHYGLVHYPDPNTLNQMENNIYNAHYYSNSILLGCIKDGDTVGAVVPSFANWIGLQPGDILKYKLTTSYTTTPSYFIRTVASVERDDEKITINFVETEDGQTFYKKALETAVNYFGNGYILSPELPESNDISFHDPGEYVLGARALYFDTICGADCVSYQVSISPEFVLLDDCEISEIMCGPSQFMIDLYRGLTFYGEGCYDDYQYCSLVGSIVSGYATGNYWPVTIDEQYGSQGLTVYPNPANELLHIQSPLVQQANYSIFTISGQLISQSNAENGYIYVSKLPAGAYLIVEEFNGNNRWGTWIKN